MQAPRVSIVIAAHGRPEALACTLRSVRAQSMQDWEALVVADGHPPPALCEDDAADPRIRLLPLPVRCGHQYGPNSVGLHEARGKHVAFLNHDDLWLPDHLAAALDGLSVQGADFWFGRAAFCHHRGQAAWQSRLQRLVFSEHNAPQALWRCIDGPNALFEPASAWVVATAFARRIGPWRAPGSAARTPVMDWVLRAAMAGGRFGFGRQTTVLKLNLHHPAQAEGPSYGLCDPLMALVPRLLDDDPAMVRARVDDDVARAPSRDGLVCRPELASPPREGDPAEAAAIARFLALRAGGEDLLDDAPATCEAMRRSALKVVRDRTGEVLDGFPPVEALLPAIAHG